MATAGRDVLAEVKAAAETQKQFKKVEDFPELNTFLHLMSQDPNVSRKLEETLEDDGRNVWLLHVIILLHKNDKLGLVSQLLQCYDGNKNSIQGTLLHVFCNFICFYHSEKRRPFLGFGIDKATIGEKTMDLILDTLLTSGIRANDLNHTYINIKRVDEEEDEGDIDILKTSCMNILIIRFMRFLRREPAKLHLLSVMAKLIAAGYNINVADSHCETPLHSALREYFFKEGAEKLENLRNIVCFLVHAKEGQYQPQHGSPFVLREAFVFDYAVKIADRTVAAPIMADIIIQAVRIFKQEIEKSRSWRYAVEAMFKFAHSFAQEACSLAVIGDPPHEQRNAVRLINERIFMPTLNQIKRNFILGHVLASNSSNITLDIANIIYSYAADTESLGLNVQNAKNFAFVQARFLPAFMFSFVKGYSLGNTPAQAATESQLDLKDGVAAGQPTTKVEDDWRSVVAPSEGEQARIARERNAQLGMLMAAVQSNPTFNITMFHSPYGDVLRNSDPDSIYFTLGMNITIRISMDLNHPIRLYINRQTHHNGLYRIELRLSLDYILCLDKDGKLVATRRRQEELDPESDGASIILTSSELIKVLISMFNKLPKLSNRWPGAVVESSEDRRQREIQYSQWVKGAVLELKTQENAAHRMAAARADGAAAAAGAATAEVVSTAGGTSGAAAGAARAPAMQLQTQYARWAATQLQILYPQRLQAQRAALAEATATTPRADGAAAGRF